MPTFNIKDEETGMQISISGDNAPQEADMPQLFSAARQNAQKQLSEGSYKKDAEFQKRSKSDQQESIKKLSASALGMSADDIDIHSGSSFKERLVLGNLPDEPSRLQYMEKKYGNENVEMLDIGGTPKMFYRDPKSNKMTMVDEQGASFADFTADIAGAAITTAGAVAGGIAGSVIPGAGTAVGTVAGATAGAALGGFVTGVGQDVLAEVATGQDVELGQKVKKRAIESAIGVPIDLATAGVGRVIAKGFGKKIISDSATQAKNALGEILEKTGGSRAMLETVPASERLAAERASRLSRTSEGLEASRVSKIHDQVDKIVEAARGRVQTDVPVEDVIFKEAEVLRQTMKQRADDIARLRSEEQLAKRAAGKEVKVLTAKAKQKLIKEAEEEAAKRGAMIDASIDRLIKKQLKGAEKLRTVTGDYIRKSTLRGLANDEKVVKELYGEAKLRTNTPNDVHSLEPVAKAFDRVMKKYGVTSAMDEKSYKLLESRLGKQVADDLVALEDDLARGVTVNFEQLNSMTRRLENRVNWKKAHGLSEDEQITKALATALRGVRDKQGRKQIGEPAWQAWKTANSEFRKKILPRTENITERSGRKIAGGSDVAVSSEKIADEALSSNQAIRQTIRSAENPDEMRKVLRGHYLSRIIDDAGDKAVKIDFDELRPLYKTDREAKAAMSRLNELNDLISRRKVKPATVTAEDIDAIVGDPLTPSGKLAMDLLKKRSALEAKQSNETFKSLRKLAKGQQPIDEDITAFVDEFVRLDARDMKQLLDRLPDDASRNSLMRSSLDLLLQMTEAGGQRGSRRSGSKMIFNPETMLKELTSNKGKWKTALGAETYDDMVRSAKVLQATPIPKPTVDEFGRTVVPKADVGGGGGLIFYATGPVRWLGRKTMDILHGSGKISRTLENITAAKEVDEELFKKIIIGAMATDDGMIAVADEAEKDKNFADWLNREIDGTEAETP